MNFGRNMAGKGEQGSKMTTFKASVRDAQDLVLRSANPPLHTLALVGCLWSVSLYCFPSMDSIDEIATPATFSNVLFPNLLTIEQVACIRLLFALVIALDSLYTFFYGEWNQDTDYYPGSRLIHVNGIQFRGMLKSNKPLSSAVVSGFLTLSSFTMWAWMLEGVAFGLLGCIPLFGWYHNPWWMRIAFLLWETVAPTALLVSAVVKYVLWPMAQQGGLRHENNIHVLKHPCALLEHNANSLFCFVEMGLLGGMPVRSTDVSLALLFGMMYLFFSWAMMHHWTPPEQGPQLIFPFFDTTLGMISSLCLLGLLATLGIFYTMVALADGVVTHAGGSMIQHVVAILIVGLLFCRFRD